MATKHPLAWAVAIAVLFWCIESTLHWQVFGSGEFQIIPADPNELWMRVLICILVVLLGWFAQSARSRLEQELAEQAARLSQVVSDQERDRQAHLSSDERYQDLVDLSPDMIWRMSRDGIMTYVSRAAKQISGFEPEEIIGTDIAEIVAQTTGDMTLVRLMEGPTPTDSAGFEVEFPRQDGTSYTAEVRSVPVLDGDGRVIEFLGIARDISDRKRLEEDLARSEARYRSIFETARDAIVTIDADSRIVYWNPGAEEVFGYSADEMLGQSLLRVMPQRFHDAHKEAVKRAVGSGIAGGTRKVIEREGLRRDGSEVLLEYTLAQWRIGTETFFTAIIRNVTEQKRIDEELLKVKKLESVTILAGGIAHDLNNYLTAVVGNLSLARSEQSPEQREQSLDNAEKAALNIRNLTQQLLTFARGGAPVLRAANMSTLLKETVSFSFRGSPISVDAQIADDLRTACIDAGQIGQVIQNLLINAQQAMPSGGTIRVIAANVDLDDDNEVNLPAGSYIKLAIQDEGVGIAPEKIERVFDPFFTTKATGTGLGLSTSLSIVQKHGGHIGVKSRGSGTGTTFYVMLPSLAEAAPEEHAEERAAPIRGKGKILVLDDDEQIRNMTTRMLTNLGYSATICSDGLEAIELFEESALGEPFDVLILDLTIPGGIGGREVIHELRARYPTVKAVVTSGYATDEVMDGNADSGFDAALPKPYGALELSRVLDRLINADATREI